MNKLLLLITLLTFNASFGQSTSLNAYAQEMKDSDDPNMVKLYNNIRNSAIDIWDGNHVMIVSTINQYVDSWVELVEYLGNSQQDDAIVEQILLDAIEMWTDDSEKKKIEALILSSGSDEALYCCRTNWRMVLETFKKQIEASKAY